MNYLIAKTFLAAMLVVPGSSVFASDLNNNTNTSFEVKPGEISFEVEKNTVTFGVIDMNDVIKEELPYSKNADPGTVTIEDPRGTGEGYHLSVKADTFKNTDRNHQLNPGTLLIDRTGAAFTGPGGAGVNVDTGEVSIDNNTVSLLSAGQDQGFAINTLKFKSEALKLKINQKDIKEGSYKSTVTYTLSSGPSA